jgi:quinol monooxygenase YgiN
MHRRTILGLVVAALFSLSSEMVRADEQVIIVGRHHPAPGREAELEARLLRILNYLKQAEPNVNYRLHRSAKEPTVFLFYEVFPSQAALDHERETVAALRKNDPPPEGIFSRPAEVETYRLLAQ